MIPIRRNPPRRPPAVGRETATLLVAIVLASPGALASPDAQATATGVVAERPNHGRSVAAGGRFLVAYRQTIPGTEVAFEMAPLPAGRFLLGSPESEPGRSADEGPRREVTTGPFWIGRCEVTWAEYRCYMRLANAFERFDDRGTRRVTDANRVDAVTAPSKLYDPAFTYASGEGDRLPAVSMSQYAAKQYTKWLSLLTGDFYRLPTEAEWEYACRAGSDSAYSFGGAPAELDAWAWSRDNSAGVAHPTGQKEPNAWGLHDMHGNAAEWVLDGYAADAYEALPAGGVGAVAALRRATRLYPRVLRGGSCLSPAADCRSAARAASDDDDLRVYDPNAPQSPWWFASDDALAIGFRIVRPWPPPPERERPRYWDADLPRIQQVADFRIDEEGRGERGIVDPSLPDAIREFGEE